MFEKSNLRINGQTGTPQKNTSRGLFLDNSKSGVFLFGVLTCFVSSLDQGRISSIGKALDRWAGGRGFDPRGRTNTQGLKITEKWRNYLCHSCKPLDLRVACMTSKNGDPISLGRLKNIVLNLNSRAKYINSQIKCIFLSQCSQFRGSSLWSHTALACHHAPQSIPSGSCWSCCSRKSQRKAIDPERWLL